MWALPLEVYGKLLRGHQGQDKGNEDHDPRGLHVIPGQRYYFGIYLFVFPSQAMARDARNYYQDTPKQIRNKIILFQSIPEQYNPYLKGISEKKTGEVMDTR